MENNTEITEPLLPGIEGDASFGSELLATPESQSALYSGKIVEKNKERVDQIIQARAMGFPIRQICTAFKVSSHTIAELEQRHATKLATLKGRLARKFGIFVELGLDRAINEVDKIDIDKLMVSLGIATDKMQVLSDSPSIIVGQSGEGPKRFSVDTLNARLRNVTGTGSDGEESAQTREASIVGSWSRSRPEVTTNHLKICVTH